MEEKESTAESLGFYMGEYIVHTKLTGLGCDHDCAVQVQVTWGEAQELKRLSDTWSEKYHEDKEGASQEWNDYIRYRYMLKEKYLPHVLTCRLPKVELDDVEGIKKGLINSLWHSDVCNYSLNSEDINIYNEPYDGWSRTVVELKLSLDIESHLK
ncbi:MAG: hypothetical protein AABY15_02255 [Nanoarchaeota archaeon]